MSTLTRRNFLKAGALSIAASPVLSALANSGALADQPQGKLIWSVLLHLGRNMWGDTPRAYTPPVDKFTCDVDLWLELTEKAAKSGLNMIVIDLGEAVKYQTHPELAVEGAWSVERLREDLDRMRKLGLEPIPKLNFSACHDFWLGEYARMLSTKTYYKVCADLIKEVTEIFDHPRFFHLGYDEENYGNQKSYDYVVIRQGELWKHDFLFFVEECEKNNVRPWIWADYAWDHNEFLEWAPKSVVMSNWYYGNDFNPESNARAKMYMDFDAAGYDQIPTGSNWSNDENFGQTVEFCKKNLSKERLLGYLQTPWKFTEPSNQEHNLRSIQQVADAMY
ncbi:MAG: hypothetical protein IJM30_03550 [Thermoguttaceae bacterium]|nr:hypothetical protein [Thermoguttaceae bacterium]